MDLQQPTREITDDDIFRKKRSVCWFTPGQVYTGRSRSGGYVIYTPSGVFFIFKISKGMARKCVSVAPRAS